MPTLVPYFAHGAVAATDETVEPVGKPTSVACGRAHTFIVCEGGVCHSFGRNTHGQLGLQSLKRSEFAKRFLSPRRVFIGKIVEPPSAATQALAGGDTTSRSKASAAMLSPKSHRSGSYLPGFLSTLEKQPMFEHADVVHIACGADHTVVVSRSGDVYTAGSDEFGQLGLGRRVTGEDAPGELAEADATTARTGTPPRDRAPSRAASGHMTGRSSTTSSPPPGTGRSTQRGGGGGGGGLSTARTVASSQYPGLLPGTVAFRKIPVSASRAVMAACGDHFSVVLTELRDVFTFGRGDSGQLGHGTLDHSNAPQLVKGMQLKETELITCRSDQVVCVCRTGEVYWWGSGLRYRPDDVVLEGVKKEVLEGRLTFSKALPTDPKRYMVSAGDKSAPNFKQRVADYYKKRGVFSQSVIDALGIARSDDSLLALTIKKSPKRRRVKPRLALGEGSSMIEEDDGKDGDGAEGVDSDKHAARVAQPEWMDMAMSVMSLVPVKTILPKDTRVTRIMCGEDFYIAQTECTCMAVSRIASWEAFSDDDIRELEVMKQYSRMRAELEKMYGRTLAEVIIKGKEAEQQEAAHKAKLERMRADEEQDEELRGMMRSKFSSKFADDDDGIVRGWKSVIQAIASTMKYNLVTSKPPSRHGNTLPPDDGPLPKAKLAPLAGLPSGHVSARSRHTRSSAGAHTPARQEPTVITITAGDLLRISVQVCATLLEPCGVVTS